MATRHNDASARRATSDEPNQPGEGDSPPRSAQRVALTGTPHDSLQPGGAAAGMHVVAGQPGRNSAATSLVARARLGLWVIIASNVVFALTDLRLAEGVLARVFLLKLLQLGVAATALGLLRRPRSHRVVVGIVLAVACLVCVLVAVSGSVSRDIATTMILCIAFAWGTATLLPWGMLPQCAVVVITALAMLLNVYLVDQTLASAFGYPSVAVTLALGISVFLAYEFSRHRDALIRESQQRTRAQKALRTSEADLCSIFEHLSDLFLRTDLDGTIQLVSPSVQRYGYAVAEVIGRKGSMLWADASDGAQVLALAIERGALRDFELTVCAKDGRKIPVSANMQLVFDERGEPIALEGLLRDITERKRVEANLRIAYDALDEQVRERTAELEASNLRLRDQERFVSAVIDTVGALVGVVDRQGRVVRFNRACERIFGYSLEEVRGRGFWELLPVASEIEPAKAVFQRLLAGDWPTTYDTYWLTRSGERVSLLWSTTFLRNDAGAIEYVIGTGIDITERKRAVEALRRSEEYWRALIEQAGDLTAVLGADATIRYVSPSVHRLLGYAPDEWIGRNGLDFIHPEDTPAVVEGLRAGLEHRDTGESTALRIRHHDGSWRDFEGTDTNLLENETVRGIVVNVRDVTERKRAEEALRASEERYRDLFENAHDIVYIHDLAGNFSSVNRAAEKVTGYDRKDALCMNVSDIVAPTDLPRMIGFLQGAAKGSETPTVLEVEIVTKDKRAAVLEVSPRIIRQGGVTVAVQGIARDVTERNRAEQRTSTLLDVAGLIAGIRDRNELLERVQRRTVAALRCDAVATFSSDDNGQSFRLISEHGLSAEMRAAAGGLVFSPSEPFGGRVAAGEAFAVHDVQAQDWLPQDLRSGLAALIIAPLRVRDRHLGALVALRSAGGQPFEADQVELCIGIARQLALAMDGIALSHAQQSEAEITAAVAQVARELISSLNAPALLERLCRLTAAALECDFSHTYVWEPAEDAFVPASGHGDTAEQWESIRILKLDRRVAPGLFAQLDQDDVVQIRPSEIDDPLIAALQKRYGITVCLYALLRTGGERMALLTAGYRGCRESFTPKQEQIARGITRIAALALQNALLFGALERANRLKSDFMASMSHELRTPLNIMIGYGNLLLEGAFGALAEEQSETLVRMQRSAWELLELIQNTLDISRLEAGRSPLQLEDVALSELIAQIKQETQPLWDRPGIEFHSRIDARVPTLHTDPIKLKVVLKNLVANAIKFTDRGRISIEAEADSGGVAIVVIDTGVGIAPEDIADIFEQFRQGEHGKRRFDGLGLGLYIARRMIQLLGGTISVESEPGQGSSFRVWIPARIDGRGGADYPTLE